MAEKTGRRYGIWIIMILLFIGLLGFGTGGLGGNIRTIGSVGDKDIRIQDYQNELSRQINAFETQIGTTLTFQQAQAFGIDTAVLRQIVSTRALENEATALGISVGDARVRDEVLRIPAFQGLSGSFDREAYRLGLRQSGMSEAEFEAGIRDEIARSLLQGAIVGGVPMPDVFADTVVSYITERRDLTWALVDRSHLTAPLPGPTDADLEKFYDDNPDLFTQGEQRAITYAWLTPEMIQDALVIDEDALRALYDDRITEYQQPERRLVERLVFGDEAEASAAIAAITAGTTRFETLVSDRGLALADADMGDVDKDSLGTAGEAVFTAAPGDIIGPFDTNLGPAIFRMNAILAAQSTSFDAAKPALREELSAARARRVIEDQIEGINDLMAGGATVEDLASRTDLQLGTITWGEGVFDDIAAYEEFRTAATNAEEGAFLNLEIADDGSIFVLRLDGITPPAVRPLADVQPQLATAWGAAQQKQAIMDRAEELAAQVLPVTDFASLGLIAKEEPTLTRQSFIEGTPQGFTQAVYAMQPGDVQVIEAGANAIILRLNAILAAQDATEETAANREALGNTAAAGIAQDIFEIFANEVQQRTDVNIDQAALNAVHVHLQ